ncbi:TOPRIM nucleotidyl transferase/hydrolase domain-containing protein [Methylobacterium sp. 88A]|uniref:ATP-dependent nuclease n=1 Tax=Methylobacterium sp. 88A TaxID=1131813 RepID=UPI00037689BE|nr:TOPRIM nucleotidyl transferase/hydrolase domain-containing protein [Methylobacterium sp. 88A]
MHIATLKLWNFRGFASTAPDLEDILGPHAVEVDLEAATNVFIGRNGAGKSSVILALLRLFGETRDERSVQPADFFVPPGQGLDSVAERRLFIEATFQFPELAEGGGDAEKTVPPTFRHMIVDNAGEPPFARVRLEATWQVAGTLDGVVEEALYWILGSEGVEFGDIDPLRKRKVVPGDRGQVLVRYIPASRDVTALTQLTVRSLGRSLMKAVKWEKKAQIDALIAKASEELDQETAIIQVNTAINACWSQLNAAETGTIASLSILAPDLQQIVRAATMTLTPSSTGRVMGVEDLSDGQRSLFHFALVKALLDLKLDLEKAAAGGDDIAFQTEFARAPALTIFAFEEPENHLAPYFLSRLLTQLEVLTKTGRVQGVVTSHAPAIVGRIEPTAIRHVRRVHASGASTIKRLALPEGDAEAAKFVREAVRAHPEIYFARHAVFGEGPSEEIVIPRLAEALGVPIDRSFVAIVPIGGRHIQHFWRLVEQLGIPSTTLLDLDLGRSSGDFQQFRAAATALRDSKRVLSTEDQNNIMTALSNKRPTPKKGEAINFSVIESWTTAFESQGIFISSLLDLDMLMLKAFPKAYKTLPPGATGPRMPNDAARQLKAAERVLGEDGLGGGAYDGTPEMSLFPWYAYLFLGDRGKPAVHLAALGELSDTDLELSCPAVLSRLIAHIRASLEASVA